MKSMLMMTYAMAVLSGYSFNNKEKESRNPFDEIDIGKEYFKIKDKKSSFSKSERDWIVFKYEHYSKNKD
jgi:hypothetical protein